MDDLNKITVKTDDGSTRHLLNNSTKVGNAEVEVVFRDVKERLLKFIDESEVVVGCVAWLTCPDILSKLGQGECSLIVQKEDFLRPDHLRVSKKDNKDAIRAAYSKMKCSLNRHAFRGIMCELSTCGDPSAEPIRCVGNYNNGPAAKPRMHNKFLISCKIETNIEPTYGTKYHTVVPIQVWTGSFNFSYTANCSFENAVIVKSPEIAKAYLSEFEEIYSLSESLNWDKDWVEPELRVGT